MIIGSKIFLINKIFTIFSPYFVPFKIWYFYYPVIFKNPIILLFIIFVIWTTIFKFKNIKIENMEFCGKEESFQERHEKHFHKWGNKITRVKEIWKDFLKSYFPCQQRKVFKFKSGLFEIPPKTYQNQWENMVFCSAENMKNADTEWRFLGDHQKRLHFKFVLFLTFAQMLENILEN